MRRIGALIARVLRAPNDAAIADAARREATELCAAFPAPGIPQRA
jgi:glycine/serine hydroxymethyltransferase